MIRRLFLTLAAAVAMVASPLAVDLAQAREHGQGQGRGQGGGPRFERPRGEGPRYEGPRGGGPQYERRGGGWDRGGPPDWPRYGGPPRERYAPEPDRERPRGSVVRPGRYLPPSYRGDVIEDYGRYRLRPPPRGYVWVRVGRGMALVAVDDGQIFDVVPY